MDKFTTLMISILTFFIVMGILIFFGSHHPKPISGSEIEPPIVYHQITPVVQPPTAIQMTKPKLPHTLEPQWIAYPPLQFRARSDATVLGDIESHMPAGHIYTDPDRITWGHETSHGLASQIRMQYSGGIGLIDFIDKKPYFKLNPAYMYTVGKINGFYVLNDRAVIIMEPQTTLRAVARSVPPSLRGMSFNLYLGSQVQSWNDCPLYLIDEFIAYTNGSAVRADLKITDRGESVTQMLEMGIYVMSEAMVIKTDDSQFKNFVMWSLDRMMKVYRDNRAVGGVGAADAYWNIAQTTADAENLRQFIRNYYGKEWVKMVLGF